MAEKVDEGGWAVGEGPPSAAAYNSEEERLGALMPDTDEVALMEKRKLKVQKLIAKKKTVSLNPRKVKLGILRPQMYDTAVYYLYVCCSDIRLQVRKKRSDRCALVLSGWRQWRAVK